ncbi:hypothetical protein EVC24_030 [Rhizobium phage RHph_I4]|nr:hypothetical protein EVC24_030 [Rhizobium phage RHph_I4]
MFDDFMKDLQSTLSTGKMDGLYDFHIAKLRDMAEGQRRAHIMSMKHSQKHDYNADLRLVITEDDDRHPGLDPWKLESYNTPGLREAADAAKEIVIRLGGVEQKVKG